MNLWNRISAIAKSSKAWSINHAPELLLAGGIVSFAGAIVMSARAGSRTEEILEEHKVELNELKLEMAQNPDIRESNVPVQYFRTAGKLAIEYAPAVGFAAVSLTCFCSSYGIMKKRYTALSAAYIALEESFRKYRERVIEDKGADADSYYLTGQKPEVITEKNEDGSKTKRKVYKELPDGSLASPYAFKFGKWKENGERNLQWQNDAYMNLSFVQGMIDYLDNNLRLRCVLDDDGRVIKRGAVMLNEMRDCMGEDPCTVGSVVGNLYGPGEPGCNGFIQPAIYECTEMDWETGKEISCIWIDPNVDGLIYDKLDDMEPNPFYPKNQEYLEEVS